MGGPAGTRGYINYDINAKVGIKDNVANFKNYFPPSTVSSMLVNNPMAHFINHITDSMKKGGTVTIRGQFANKHFSSLWDADAIPGFQIIKKTRDVEFKGFKTDGKPITGQVNELILKKI